MGDIDWELLNKLADRRDKATKIKPHCPKCGTPQVQLKDWYTDNIQFKCRLCSNWWQVKLDEDSL